MRAHIMRACSERLVLFRAGHGQSLVDTLVGLGILGVFVAALLGGISTGVLSLDTARESTVAKNLAGSQMEYVKGLPFQEAPTTYAVVPEAASGYSVEARAEAIPGLDQNIQRIVVTVYEGDRAMLAVEAYKVRR